MNQPNPSLPLPSQSFWAAHWDKVISIVLSLVVGGVAGFFSAVLAIQDEVHSVSTRVTTLETEASTVWRPKTAIVDSLRMQLDTVDRLLKEVQLKNQADALLRERLQTLRDDTRKETASEIQQLLKEFGVQK